MKEHKRIIQCYNGHVCWDLVFRGDIQTIVGKKLTSLCMTLGGRGFGALTLTARGLAS